MIKNILQYFIKSRCKTVEAIQLANMVPVNESVPFDPAEWEDVGFSSLTWRVLGWKYGFASLEEIPGWAYEMMQLGFDTPNLCIVACISNADHYDNFQPYLENAWKELGYPELTEDEAAICFTSIFMKKIAKSIEVKTNFYSLVRDHEYRLASTTGENLRFLYYAWEELDNGAEVSYEWEQIATKNNISNYCVAEARRWLLRNYDFLHDIRKHLIQK